jgi:hypothetical protein
MRLNKILKAVHPREYPRLDLMPELVWRISDKVKPVSGISDESRHEFIRILRWRRLPDAAAGFERWARRECRHGQSGVRT